MTLDVTYMLRSWLQGSMVELLYHTYNNFTISFSMGFCIDYAAL